MPKKNTLPPGKSIFRGVLMDIEDVLIRLHFLPDSVTLTSSEAALFLAISITSLDRMRVAGTGPAYMQGGSYGAKGTNQACTYHKKDLIAWQEGHKVTSSLQAAILKGQTFSTIFEIAQQEAFYVDPHGNIEGMCERTEVETIIKRLGQWEIVWMTPVEAASREWSSLPDHKAFAYDIQTVLKKATSAVAAGVDVTDMAEGIGYGTKEGTKHGPI